jgi:hypothetical protein
LYEDAARAALVVKQAKTPGVESNLVPIWLVTVSITTSRVLVASFWQKPGVLGLGDGMGEMSGRGRRASVRHPSIVT